MAKTRAPSRQVFERETPTLTEAQNGDAVAGQPGVFESGDGRIHLF